MKFLKVLCAIVLVAGFATVAQAETQSVKVSGDIAAHAFARNNYDLDNNSAETPVGVSNDWASYMLSTVEVQVDADLTDNVSGVIRLVNQRVWGDNQYFSNTTEVRYPNAYMDGTVARQTFPSQGVNLEDNFDVNVDLAYIELKEFLYSPLTLRIGRQDLWFGKGFIIGNSWSQTSSIYPAEYTAVTSFDAIRATLDYDPWTIDAVYAKIAENGRRADDDTNLFGINVGYVFDAYNAEAEAYWWMKQDRFPGTTLKSGNAFTSTNGVVDNNVQTLGMRGSFDPIEDWTIALEGAYQFGDFIGANSQQNERDRSAWAIDAMVECRYWQDDFAWRPVVSAEYIFYSGEEDMGDENAASTGDYNGWNPMYRGKTDTKIREFQNWFYGTAQASSPAYTNQHQILIRGTLEPTDSLTFNALYGHFWLAEEFTNTNSDKNLGDEVDLELVWDYTEDVTFGLTSAWFFPGEHFAGDTDDVATDLVGSVKLSF